MAKTGLVQDERFQYHITGDGHPERPQRLKAVSDLLAERGLDQSCIQVGVFPVDMDLVRRIHDDVYLDRLERACTDGMSFIDTGDSCICEESFEVAKLAAGSVVQAVDEVMAGRLDNALCAVRPPGHHAERDRSMGFCLLNNIAIAAQHLIDDHGLSRVLILDWDVHHGNGTQHIFEADSRVMFVSLHGHPNFVYPGTGFENERGRGKGEGYTLNLPMMPPSSNAEWQRAFEDIIIPAIKNYDPQFVLISAGFDAHRDDPLAPLEIDTPLYGWMTDQLINIAREHCSGKIVSVLEGGYHLGALSECVSLHLERLLNA